MTLAEAVDSRGAARATGAAVAQDIGAAPPQQFVGHGDLALVQKAHDFIAAQYVTPFTRGDLARVLGVSEAYVSRVFRRVTGRSLWEYVNQYRIQCACELLERTAMSVTEVALAVGYNDPAYFSRIFRSETGRSPQAYRKRPAAASSPASTREPV